MYGVRSGERWNTISPSGYGSAKHDVGLDIFRSGYFVEFQSRSKRTYINNYYDANYPERASVGSIIESPPSSLQLETGQALSTGHNLRQHALQTVPGAVPVATHGASPAGGAAAADPDGAAGAVHPAGAPPAAGRALDAAPQGHARPLGRHPADRGGGEGPVCQRPAAARPSVR